MAFDKEKFLAGSYSIRASEVDEVAKEIEEQMEVVPQIAIALARMLVVDEERSLLEKEEKYSVYLEDRGSKPQKVRQVVQDFLHLGLMDSWSLMSHPPTTLIAGLPRDQAEDFQKKLEDAGARVLARTDQKNKPFV